MSGILRLGGNPAARYLPWSVGLLMFIATIFLAFGLVLTDAGTDWQERFSGTISVQIPADSWTETGAYGGVPQDDRTTRAIEELTKIPRVISVRRLTGAEAAALLQPWIGSNLSGDVLPTPIMIDVRTEPMDPADFRSLKSRLREASPGVIVDDHGHWLAPLSEFTRLVSGIVFAVILLVLFTAVTTVIFITRTNLAIHRSIVELLHIIGARDYFVARHFQVYAAKLVAIGSLAGTALGAAVVYGLQRRLSDLSHDLIPVAPLDTVHWVLLCLLPLVATLFAAVVAERTVAQALRRMV